MGNSIFFLDEDPAQSLSYQSLIEQISSASFFYPYLRTASLPAFFSNLCLGLVSGKHITLLDADFGDSLCTQLTGRDDFAEAKEPVSCTIASIEELMERIEKSNARLSLFTSGTTGQPKQVTQHASAFLRSVKRGGRHAEARWGFCFNPTHMAGLQVFFQAISNGCPLYNLFGKSRAQIFSAIRARQLTHISATPTFYRMLMPADEPFSCVAQATLGGERSTAELIEKIGLLFPQARVTNIYASTEAGALLAAHGDSFSIPAHLQGLIKIEDGELLIARSLLGQELSGEGGWYHTGDLVEQAEGGQSFRFASRKNEMINVGGNKVNPQEVEDSICIHPQVQQAYVYGKKNSVLGYLLACELVLLPGADLSEAELREFLASRLQAFKIPRYIKFVECLSQTRTAKLKRS